MDVFYGLPEWFVFLVLLGFMVVACETGYRLAIRSRSAAQTKALVPTITGSVLALLGLLLGFTMSMAVSRYDARCRLVLDSFKFFMSTFGQPRARGLTMLGAAVAWR